MKKTNFLGIFCWLCMVSLSSMAFAGMVPLDDKELSQQTGQALFMMDKTTRATGADTFTFYKMGLDAVMDINTNIKKLQLGCGGVNGVGCDIDIDNLSLSGPENCAGGRAGCSAQLTRPFVEFAVKNDGVKTQRELVGFRFSAEKALGLMSLGYQDASTSEAASKNGINSLSGYIRIGSASGTAVTESRPMSYGNVTYGGKNYTGLGQPITGNLWLTVLGIINDVVGISSTNYNLTLQEAVANVVTNPTTVSGTRMTSVDLLGSATINPINFSGPMTAYVSNLLGLGINLDLQKDVTGTITGLTATVPIQQNLGYIHKINVNNPFSLSMQKQDILWPTAAAAAQRGWWMAFEDEINIGSISPANKVELTNDVLLQALNGATGNAGSGTVCTTPSVNCALYRGLGTYNGDPYGIRCNGLDACLGGSLAIGTVSVPRDVNFPLMDLKLGAQNVIPNCWGTARFC